MTTKKTTENTVEENAPTRITLSWHGTDYVLEYDRDSAVRTESVYDVSLQDVQRQKVSTFEPLFFGALIKHHPKMKADTAQKLFDAAENRVELFRTLVGMYAQALTTLFDEETGEAGNAASWSVS